MSTSRERSQIRQERKYGTLAIFALSAGEPDAGSPHVRFDERGDETERCPRAQAFVPLFDSTSSLTGGVYVAATQKEPGEACASSRFGFYVQRWIKWTGAGLARANSPTSAIWSSSMGSAELD